MGNNLQDVADVFYGKSQIGVADQYGKYPIIGTGGIIGSASRPLFNGPAIIVGRKGTLNNPIFVENDFWAVDTTYAVIPKKDIDTKWLYFTLCNYRLEILNEATGVPSINRDRLYKVPVQNIEFSEQKRIALIIDRIDEVISSTEAVISKLKKERLGMLHDLLSYGLNENGEIRDPVRHPEQFKDSPLGRVPKEWDVNTLRNLCMHIGSGLTPRGGQEVYTDSGVMFIRSQNVTYEGLKLQDVAYIPNEIHLGMLRSEVFAYDVLYNITGASIGRCCIMPKGLGPANVNQHVCILRIPNAKEGDSVFLANILSSNIGKKQLESLNTCGNRQGLNYQQLGSFFVPWPQFEERCMISQHINEVEKPLSDETNVLEKLKLIKSGLREDLLTGKVRIPKDFET